MITGIDHIQLAMPQGGEDRARRFFGAILGMKELPKPNSLKDRGGVWFTCGMQELHVGVDPKFNPAKKAHPAFLVKDLETVRCQIIKLGVEVRQEPPLPNAERLFVEDPFGNRIELIERLGRGK